MLFFKRIFFYGKLNKKTEYCFLHSYRIGQMCYLKDINLYVPFARCNKDRDQR